MDGQSGLGHVPALEPVTVAKIMRSSYNPSSVTLPILESQNGQRFTHTPLCKRGRDGSPQRRDTWQKTT